MSRISEEVTYSALDTLHPAVQLLFFGVILVFCMAALHPVYLGLSFLSAISFSVYLCGWRASLRSMIWLLPIILLTAFINPLFSSLGSTELISLGKKIFYLESFMFGLCMGVMLVSVILWFSNAAQLLSSDKVMSVLGTRIPILALVISMTMRFVPRFVEQGTQISETAQACSSARGKNGKEKMGANIRLTSVLMAWSMENSLETADAMRVRGWGARVRRSTYQRYHMRAYDVVVAWGITTLAGINAVLAWSICSAYSFYPVMDVLSFRVGFVLYAVLVFAPLLFCLLDDLRWKRIDNEYDLSDD